MPVTVRRQHRRQRGAVLIVSLLILVMLTLLTLTSIQASSMQERLAGNTRNLDIALQAAEAALRAGETGLQADALPTATGANGWYHWSRAPAPDWSVPSVWESGSSRLTYAQLPDDSWNTDAAPQYAIEELPPMQDPGGSLEAGGVQLDDEMYRVSARAWGASDRTFVILQTTFRR